MPAELGGQYDLSEGRAVQGAVEKELVYCYGGFCFHARG